ncbi:conserved hypothetical protein [Oleispira antarctica RB-8]|uniref:Cytochrome b561 bacterial/Ni-hydrogenase domain-containing protein n=1 Tax=Oleispira antarctica RB-8 TaxID=698738 RepID=R4YPF0_OLEAN|nr:conserved hypothetical protein [Oleispira antarctica RB-8]
MNIFKKIMEYLRERQLPMVRYLHITIIILVISQIIVSNFMGFTSAGDISPNTIEFYGTWLHILTGLFIIPIAFVFIIIELKQHGFKYYFPYLSGEVEQLKNDINQLLKFKLPEPNAYGIAAIIQGLGLGALFLVILSGLTWFIAWNANLSWSHDIKEIHEFLTGLIQAYIIGHGCMGILHIYLHSKSKKNS